MKTLIWDYNGTILDDVSITVEIENLMLKERNLPYGYTIEDYRNLFAIPMYDYYLKIGYTFEHETFEDAAKEFTEHYERLFPTCLLNPGVIETLQQSIQKGYRNVILSSCHDGILHEQCKKLGIDHYFEEIMGTDDVLGGSKIHIGLDWMKRHHINPDDCIYFGDTFADQDTAKAMGINKIYFIANGHQSYERLSKINPHTYHTLKEVQLP